MDWFAAGKVKEEGRVWERKKEGYTQKGGGKRGEGVK